MRTILPGRLLAAFAASVLLLGNAASGQICTNYEARTPGLVGELPLAGDLYGVAVADDLVLVTARFLGLHLVDISDPAQPVQVGFHPESLAADPVAIRDGIAYLGHYLAGLVVLDVSDPAAPEVLGTLGRSANVLDVVVAGDRVHVLAADGLWVVDVSVPAAPALLGVAPLAGDLQGACALGEHVYVASGAAGIRVVDVSDPAAPVPGATVDLPGNIVDVAAGPGVLCATSYLGTVTTLDVSDPALPVPVGEDHFSAYCLDITLAGGRVYAANQGVTGVKIVDVADPHHPRLDGIADGVGEPRAVAVTGHLACVASGDRLFVTDVSVAAPYPVLGRLLTLDGGERFAQVGDTLYVVGSATSLQVFDVSDPVAPEEVTRFEYTEPGTRAVGIAVAGGVAYLADWTGLFILDITGSPEGWQTLSFTPTSSIVRDVAVADGKAYVSAAGAPTISVYDVADPSAPVLLSEYDTGACEGGRLVAAGDWLYAATLCGLVVFDMSDPEHPAPVASLGVPVSHLALAGTTLAASGGGVLRILDVADPAAIAEQGAVTAFTGRVALRQEVAYLGQSSRLVAFDVADPASPRLLGTWYLDHDGGAVGVHADVRPGAPVYYLASQDFVIFRPQCVDQVPVFLAGFWVAPGGGGLVIEWRVGDDPGPQAFRLRRRCGGRSADLPVVARGGGLFRSVDADAGGCGPDGIVYTLLLVRPDGTEEILATESRAPVEPPALIVLGSPYPNPFNPRVHLAVRVARPQPVRVTVHDLAGRLVRRLREGILAAGEHELVWDGTDDGGRPLPSGGYVLRAAATDGVATRKLNLLR